MAPATPAERIVSSLGAIEPEVAREPVRLVPKQDVRPDLDRRVDPAVQQCPQPLAVQASNPDRAAIGQDLAGVHFPGYKLAEGLAAEYPGYAPGIHVHFHAELVSHPDDLAHGPDAVDQVA